MLESQTASVSPTLTSPPGRRFAVSARVVPSLLGALDSVVILSAGLITFLITVADQAIDPSQYAAAVCFVWLTTVLLMSFAGLYQFDPIMHPLAYADKIVMAFVTTILFLLAAAFALKISTDYSRIWVTSFAIASCLGTLVSRAAAGDILRRLADSQVFTRNVVVVGLGDQAFELLAHLEKAKPHFISVLGLFSVAGAPRTVDGNGRFPVLGTFEDLPAYARLQTIDDVIIALPWSADGQIVSMVNKLRELPMNVYLAPDVIGFRLPLRPPPDHFGDLSVVEVMGRPLAGWGLIQKTVFDYALGLLLTILFLPIMALIALAIKIDSRGPVLFRQERYGFVNRVFWICKFRTMKHVDTAEEQTIQATRDDPRVTRVGALLRRTSLDELPQLFNVLGGSMSLVGPRPHAIDHNEGYAQVIRGYFARHRVKPGITGWAQVNGLRGETKTVADMEARVRHDIHYTENWSLLFDLKILAMTLIVWFTGRNAY